MFSKMITTAFLTITVFTATISAYAVPELAPRAVSVTPKDLVGIEHALQVIDAIPIDVLESGQEATTSWLETNGATIQASSNALAVSGAGASANGLVVQDVWDVLQCVAAVAELLVSGVVPAAKLLRLKSIISKLGGLRKAIDALFSSKGNLANAAKLVKELVDIITGFGNVRDKCL
jgi:hypothetical protein